MPIPAIAAGAAPAIIGGVSSLIGGASANKANRREARKNRDFQERMRNTSWQAAIEDMKAAGINPAIAYSKGPAAAPSGSMAQQRDVITPAVTSGLQSKRLQADLTQIQAQNLKTAQETITSGASAEFIRKQSRQLEVQTRQAEIILDAYLEPDKPRHTGKGPEVAMGSPQYSSRLVREKLEAEIRNLRARSGQTETTQRVIEPVAKLMDEMGIWGPIAAGLGRIMGPGFARRVQIPKFRGRKLKLPKFRIPIKWSR